MDIISDLDNFVSFCVSCGLPSSFTNVWAATCHQWRHQIPFSAHFCWTLEGIHERSVERPHNFGLQGSLHDSTFQLFITPVCMSIDVHKKMSHITQKAVTVEQMSVLSVPKGNVTSSVQWMHGILELQTLEIMAWACRSAPVPHPHANETKDSHDLSRTFWHPHNEGHCKGCESGLLNSFPSDLVKFVHSMYIECAFWIILIYSLQAFAENAIKSYITLYN